MVKFKSQKLSGPPQPLQIYRYWGSHRFVQVISVQGNVATTIPFGSLRGGVFTPAARATRRQYQLHGQYLYPFKRNGTVGYCPLTPGTIVVC